MEVKTVINNILLHMNQLQQDISKIDSVLTGYIEFSNDTDNYIKWIDEKVNQKKEKEKNDSKS